MPHPTPGCFHVSSGLLTAPGRYSSAPTLAPPTPPLPPQEGRGHRSHLTPLRSSPSSPDGSTEWCLLKNQSVRSPPEQPTLGEAQSHEGACPHAHFYSVGLGIRISNKCQVSAWAILCAGRVCVTIRYAHGLLQVQEGGALPQLSPPQAASNPVKLGFFQSRWAVRAY